MAGPHPRPPKYTDPPLVEVLCGVAFDPLPALQEPQVALFWHEQAERYPSLAIRPPLRELRLPGQPNTVVLAQNRPPMGRFWLSKSGSPWLLQIQSNRVIVNWRKKVGQSEHAYGGFPKVYRRFTEDFGRFSDFLQRNGMTNSIRGYEVQYFGHIPYSERMPGPEHADVVFPWLNWQPTAHLQDMVEFRWSSTFSPPELPGVVSVSANTLPRSPIHGGPAIAMDIQARGTPREKQPVDDWFSMAHDHCVLAFMELTDQDVQKNNWGLQESGDDG